MSDTTPKHTPGPWTIVGERDLQKHGIDDLMIVASQVGPEHGTDSGEGLYIVNVGGPVGPVYAAPEALETNLANARLIAAAPDLLKAAKRARECEGKELGRGLCERCEAALVEAIRKAEGSR